VLVRAALARGARRDCVRWALGKGFVRGLLVRAVTGRQGLRERLTCASRHRCLCVQLTKLWRSDRQCAQARR